jgi:hypothetical protein
MKKYIRIIAVLLIFSVLLIFVACDGSHETVTYPIKSARYYTTTSEYGLITTKTDVYKHIEVIWEDNDGNIEKAVRFTSDVKLGTENIVKVHYPDESREYHEIFLTEDYYSELLGVEYVKNEVIG